MGRRDVAASGPGADARTRVALVAFANDTEIRTGTAAGTVRFWNAERSPIQGDAGRIRLWIEVITGFELDGNGSLRALDGPSWKERRGRLRELEA